MRGTGAKAESPTWQIGLLPRIQPASPAEMLSWRVLNRLASTEEWTWFDRMYALYEGSFPEDSEREDRLTWEAVLGGREAGYRLEFVIATEDEAVVAGVAIEYYTTCRCGIVTLLFVRADCRGRGLARVALERARARLQELAARKLRFVFAEVEDPVRARALSVRSAIDPARRLRILARLGARGVRIPYVQPSLGPDKPAADHLRLLVLDPPEARVVPRALLFDFLSAFYSGLLPEVDAEVLTTRVLAGAPSLIPLEPLVP